MAKTRVKKEKEVQDIVAKIERSKSLVFTTQKGVAVRDIEKLRRELRSADSELQTIKKTLLQIALRAKKLSVDTESLRDSVGLAFSYGDEVTAAKIMHSFSKKNEGMVLVGGVLEGKAIDASTVKRLAQLPSKHELLGQLVRTIQAPVAGFVNALAGNIRNLVNVVAAVRDSKKT